jgi:hypothetical protein
MAQRVDDILSEIGKGGGLADSNLYRVKLPTVNGENRSMDILCTDVVLPSRQITTREVQMGMDNTFKVAYGDSHMDINLSFILLNDFGSRYYFEAWQRTAYDSQNKTLRYNKSYVKPVIIQVLRKGVAFDITKKKLFNAGKIPSSIRSRLPRLGPLDFAQGQFDLNFITSDDIIYEIELEDCFPYSMSEITMGGATESTILKQTVQLSFKKFKTVSKYDKGRGSQIGEALLGGVMRKIF